MIEKQIPSFFEFSKNKIKFRKKVSDEERNSGMGKGSVRKVAMGKVGCRKNRYRRSQVWKMSGMGMGKVSYGESQVWGKFGMGKIWYGKSRFGKNLV